jgi:hypothetical protein
MPTLSAPLDSGVARLVCDSIKGYSRSVGARVGFGEIRAIRG